MTEDDTTFLHSVQNKQRQIAALAAELRVFAATVRDELAMFDRLARGAGAAFNARWRVLVGLIADRAGFPWDTALSAEAVEFALARWFRRTVKGRIVFAPLGAFCAWPPQADPRYYPRNFDTCAGAVAYALGLHPEAPRLLAPDLAPLMTPVPDPDRPQPRPADQPAPASAPVAPPDSKRPQDLAALVARAMQSAVPAAELDQTGRAFVDEVGALVADAARALEAAAARHAGRLVELRDRLGQDGLTRALWAAARRALSELGGAALDDTRRVLDLLGGTSLEDVAAWLQGDPLSAAEAAMSAHRAAHSGLVCANCARAMFRKFNRVWHCPNCGREDDRQP